MIIVVYILKLVVVISVFHWNYFIDYLINCYYELFQSQRSAAENSYLPLEAVEINRFNAIKRLQCNPSLILHISVIRKITPKNLYVHLMIFRSKISVISQGSPVKGLKQLPTYYIQNCILYNQTFIILQPFSCFSREF